jgi:hypothetical protein
VAEEEVSEVCSGLLVDGAELLPGELVSAGVCKPVKVKHDKAEDYH